MVKEAIARYIEENGIKQVFVAQRTGISPQSFSLILKDERGLDIEEYAKICDVLNVPYDYFFGAHGRKPEQNAS